MKKSFLSKVVSGFLCAVLLPVMTFSVSAEEETVKNFEYYHHLSDYEVYVEYMKTYVFTEVFPISDTLPAPKDVPGYNGLIQYTDNQMTPLNDIEIAIHVEGVDPHDNLNSIRLVSDMCTRLEMHPELLGFPEGWCTTAENGEPYSIVDVYSPGYKSTRAPDGVRFQIIIQYDRFGEFDPQFAGISAREDIFDIMRIILTLRHSEIMQECKIDGMDVEWSSGMIYGPMPSTDPIIEVSETPEVGVYGDANCDDSLNMLDIIVVNKNLLQGCEMSAQGICNADVNLDKIVNAADSLLMLQSMVGLTELPYPVET